MVTEQGRKTAPTIPTLLETLEKANLLSDARSKGPAQGPLNAENMKRIEVDRLKATGSLFSNGRIFIRNRRVQNGVPNF